MNVYRRWLPLSLLLLAALVVGLYPAAHAPIKAVQRGDKAAAQRHYSAALDAYAEAAAHCPGNPLPYLRQAEVYLAQERYEEAWAATLDAIHAGGLDDRASQMLARLYLAQGSPARAVDMLRDPLDRHPRHGETWRLLGEAQLALGQLTQARDALETALVYDLPADRRQVTHEHLALICLDTEWPADHTDSCTLDHLEAVTRGPDESLAKSAVAVVEALRPFATAEASEEPALAYAQLGRALLELGDPGRARTQFEAAVALSPTYADAHAYLGHAWSLLGQPAHAEEHLKQAIALEPESTLPRYLLGMHYLRRGWLETGRDVLVEAYEMEPQNPALCAAVADSYLRGDSPQYEVAEQWLLAAAIAAPDDVRFDLLLAHLYVEMGLDPGGRGVAAAQAAVDLAPDSAEAHETLGWAYYLSGQPALAVEPLEQALELGSSARLHYRLGQVYRALRQMDEARSHLQAALDLDWQGVIGERAREALN